MTAAPGNVQFFCWYCVTSSQGRRRLGADGGAGTGVRHFSSYISALINHGTLSAAGGTGWEWIQNLETAAAFGRDFKPRRDVSTKHTRMCFGPCLPMRLVYYLPHIFPVGSARHTKVSDSAADNGKCIILSRRRCFPFLFLWLVTAKRANSEPPYVYPLPPARDRSARQDRKLALQPFHPPTAPDPRPPPNSNLQLAHVTNWRGLSWRTQTRLRKKITTDPEVLLQKCSRQVLMFRD